MTDTVSILMPCYNAERYVDEAIQSVIDQSYSSWELLVVDDCSVDKTYERIDCWRKRDARIQLIALRANRGAAYARNQALKIAKGRYIALLDSDDLWCREKLRSQVAFMQSARTPLSFTSYRLIGEDGHDIAPPVIAPDQVDYRHMLRDSVIGCPTAVYDTAVLGKVKMPDVFHADYATWLQILRMGHVARGMQDILASYRIRHGSINRNKIKAAWHRWRVYRDCERCSLMKSMYHMTEYAYCGIKKSLARSVLPASAGLLGD